MKLFTYLNYGGNCRQAFEFYQVHLGGKITMLTTHGEQPDASKVPYEWRNAVLHARIEMGDTTILHADGRDVLRAAVRDAQRSVRHVVDDSPRAIGGIGEPGDGRTLIATVRPAACRVRGARRPFRPRQAVRRFLLPSYFPSPAGQLTTTVIGAEAPIARHAPLRLG